MAAATSPSSSELALPADSTALVLVDLQRFTVDLPTAPLSGREVLANATRLAEAFRAASALVVLVQASAGVNYGAHLKPPTDEPMPEVAVAPGSEVIAPELGPVAGDVVITKYNWGAFYGTDLDLQLRRRGIRELVVGGIATNFGVESTVRQAHEAGYAQLIVSDATTAFTHAEHHASVRTILSRVGRIRSTDQLITALPRAGDRVGPASVDAG